jgi:hypothetical protein
MVMVQCWLENVQVEERMIFYAHTLRYQSPVECRATIGAERQSAKGHHIGEMNEQMMTVRRCWRWRERLSVRRQAKPSHPPVPRWASTLSDTIFQVRPVWQLRANCSTATDGNNDNGSDVSASSSTTPWLEPTNWISNRTSIKLLWVH